jgi:hypothetical protein
VARPDVLGAEPITFQASLPDSGDWLKVNKDDARITLVVPLAVGAVLTAATSRLADQVLLVTLKRDPSELGH